jgi:hypothetical protein
MPTTYLPEQTDLPHRLGRHVNHDERSRAYRFVPRTAGPIVSQSWVRRVDVFDQGQLGSCTGNAAVGWIGTDNALRQGLTDFFGEPVNEAMAVECYSQATTIDPFDGAYPPDDTGSDGLSVTKVLQGWNLVDSYTHGFSIGDLLAAMQEGPVLIGIPWYDGMFDPDQDGRVRISGFLAGGHEVVCDVLDMVNGRVWFPNSWGLAWGVSGRGYFTINDLDSLLQNDGDVTVPHSKVLAPTPDPVVDKPGCFSKAGIRRLLRRR